MKLTNRISNILNVALSNYTPSRGSSHVCVIFNGNKPISIGVSSVLRTMIHGEVVPSFHAEANAMLNFERLFKGRQKQGFL